MLTRAKYPYILLYTGIHQELYPILFNSHIIFTIVHLQTIYIVYIFHYNLFRFAVKYLKKIKLSCRMHPIDKLIYYIKCI